MVRFAAASGIAVAIWIALASAAMAYPSVECELSEDGSSLLVMASNPDDQGYKCTASCRLNVTGQRAIERFSCNFNLNPNTDERSVCERDGGAPDFFSGVSPTKAACAPRN